MKKYNIEVINKLVITIYDFDSFAELKEIFREEHINGSDVDYIQMPKSVIQKYRSLLLGDPGSDGKLRFRGIEIQEMFGVDPSTLTFRGKPIVVENE